MGELKIVECGKRIKELREMKGMTVNKLANTAGISQSYLRSIELEKKNPTVEILTYICWALDISLKDFFDEDLLCSLRDDELLKRVYKLNRKQRKALCDWLDTMF